jgi:hypothetical protein
MNMGKKESDPFPLSTPFPPTPNNVLLLETLIGFKASEASETWVTQ